MAQGDEGLPHRPLWRDRRGDRALGVVLLTSVDFAVDAGDVALALHGGEAWASVLLRLALDTLILQQTPTDPGIVAVALKMAVVQLPRIPQPFDKLTAVPAALLLLGLGARKPCSSILHKVTNTCA